MAITSVDQAIAGMQPTRFFHKNITPTLVAGKPQSLWGLGGIPGAGSFTIANSTKLNGDTLDSSSALVAGQIPFFNPGSGNSYLARLEAGMMNGGLFLLCDRLWQNGGFTAVTTAQNITSPTWPARDNAGSTNGDGVLLGCEYNATGAANVPAISCVYTNSGGLGSKAGSVTTPIASAAAAGTFHFFGLAAGDTGVQSLQSVTFTAAPTVNTITIVAYRVLAALECPLGYSGNAIDILTGGFPQLFNGTVPFIVIVPNSTTAGYVDGSFTVTQG